MQTTTYNANSLKKILERPNSKDFKGTMQIIPYMGTTPKYIRGKTLPALVGLENHLGHIKSTFVTEEFSTHCRLIGVPDFVDYVKFVIVPEGKILEMKSLRNYLIAYRELDIYCEEAAATIITDIIKTIEPKYISIEIQWKARGGATNHTFIDYSEGGVKYA